MSFLCNWVCCEQEQKLSRSTIQIQVAQAVTLKVKNSRYEEKALQCKKSYEFFVDEEFPPNDSSLGQFQNIGRKIVWKRIVDIVPECYLFDERKSMSSSIISSATSDSYITASLLALAFDPQKIYKIFRHHNDVSIQGIYQLLVKRNGIIQCILIDDYVPVFEDTQRPLLCGSINRQIWVMLLYKAWAKICGSYSAIKQVDCFDFLNTFSIAPCQSFLLHSSIVSDAELFEEICSNLQKHEYTLCVITSSKPKFNLLPDYHYAAIGLTKEKGVQLVGGVGGKQSCIKMSINQMLQNCVELLVSKNEQKMANGQLKKFTVTFNKPSFFKMTMSEQYSLNLLIKRQKCEERNVFFRAVIARKQKDGNYSYVQSKLDSYYNDLVLACQKLPQGQYSIMVLINEASTKTTNISISCYYKFEGQLTAPIVEETESNQDFMAFMKDVLMDYSTKSKKCIKKQLINSKSVMLMQQVYRRGGFGYLLIKSSKMLQNLKVKFDFKQIEHSQYYLLNNIKEPSLILHPNEQIFLILLLKTLEGGLINERSFPPGISIVQIF